MTDPNERAAIRALARRSETDIVAALRSDLSRSPATIDAVTQRGLTLIRKAKAEGERETLVAQLMNRYRLSTEERSEEHTSELQSLMRNSYAVFCLKKKNRTNDKKQD